MQSVLAAACPAAFMRLLNLHCCQGAFRMMGRDMNVLKIMAILDDSQWWVGVSLKNSRMAMTN